MGKKCKKKVQWKQLSLNDLLTPESEKQTGDDCEEEEGDSAPHTPTHENVPYPRHPYKPGFNARRGPHRQQGFYHANYDRRFDKNFDRYNSENFRNLENRGSGGGSPYEKPFGKPFGERNYHYEKFCGRPPFYGDRNFKFGPGGFVDRGRRPFRPYGRGFFPPRGFPGHFQGPFRDGQGKALNGCEGEEDDEEWDDEGILVADGQQEGGGGGGGGNGERPSQPVHTVMINNEEYTKIQTPRQEVIFKKSSLDRKRDSIDQGSVAGSVSSGSGASSTTGGEAGSGSAGSGDQAAGDGSSVAESVEDNSLSVAGDDPPDTQHQQQQQQQQHQQQDQVFEDPNELFAGEPGGPPLAGVVMQQAYPGGPMITIPVHWTPFIDPGLIPGETALTPLDPAFTHVIDPKSLPIDPLHILPVQHDAAGCPVHVQVKVDSNGVPIQIQPTAFTVSLSSIHQHQEQQQQQEAVNSQQQQQEQEQQPENQPELRGTQPEDQDSSSSSSCVDDEGQMVEDQTQPCGEENSLPAEELDDDQKTITEGEEESKEDKEDGVGLIESAKEEEKMEAVKVEDNQNEDLEMRDVSEETEEKEVIEGEMVCEENVSVVECEVKEEKMEVEVSLEVEETVAVEEHTENELVKVDEVEMKEEGEEEQKTDQQEMECEEKSQLDTAEENPVADSSEKTKIKAIKAPKDKKSGSKTESSPAPTTAVPSKKSQEVITTSAAAPAGESRSSKRRRRRRRKNGEEEESVPEETEEKTIPKETEEASDSSDSQYASMSESSSTPTTPEGEPSDAQEAAETQVEAPCKTSASEDSCLVTDTPVPCATEVDQSSLTTDQEEPSLSGTNETNHVTSEEETNGLETSPTTLQEEGGAEEAQTEEQEDPHSVEATEKILQGYVMVPILTPYYDPSVLYGYPVVVADQHQHQHQPRGYSKRKKKKYQRRRHVEVPSTGCYLDPQLYTGEPFVATPGGYVVPVEATPVCQVHGFQYVTPFQPHPEEGFVQHSPYLPSVVPDLVAQQAQHVGGTNLDDGSKRIFSDLQERERRQIQEILQEQRAKVGKSDSTESSDSGVSESEEAVVTELSSEENLAENNANANSPECNEESTDTAEIAETLNSSGNEDQENIVCEETSNTDIAELEVAKESSQVVAKENALEVAKESSPCEISDDQNQSVSNPDASIQQISHSVETYSDATTHDAETLEPDNALKDIQNINSSCDVDYSHTEDNEQDTHFCDSSKEISSNSPTSENIAKECEKNLDDLGNKSEFDFTERPQDSNSHSDNYSSAIPEEDVQLEKEIDHLAESHITPVSQTICSSLHELPLKQENAQDNPAVSNTEILPQRIDTSPKEEAIDDASVNQESLKDLKVTEAVKRWIREVTPEKAFFLSAVQTRLIESNIQGEMDTEDEYIEDEMPQQNTQSTETSSKNAEGNPFAAASSDATVVDMESCSKRVAVSAKQRGTSPDALDDYDGSSTISNLSYGHLYSEASSSQPASFSHSFDEEEVEKYTGNPNIYNPVAYTKYYQLGVEVDDTTPSATPLPMNGQMSREATPVVQTESETVSECGSEDIETIPHKYDVVCQYTATSPMSLATEILKAEKVLSNMSHITGSHQEAGASKSHYGNPDVYLKHYGNAPRAEVGDSGVQSEESSDEMEGRSNISSSGVGSSLASTPAISPAHATGRPPLQPHPLKNLSAGDGPVPCRTVCCAVM